MTAIFTSLLFLMINTLAPAHASSYSINDLKVLVDQKEYVEALNHLKDISPTARTAEWKNLAVEVILGRTTTIKKSYCHEAFDFLKQSFVDFAVVSSDERLKLKQKEVIDCVPEKVETKEQRDQASKEHLNAAQDSIVFLYTDGGHTGSNPEVFQWILEHPEKAKLNEQLKKYAFKAAGERAAKENQDTAKLKVQSLKKAGWYDEWIKSKAIEINSYANEMMKGSFDHQDIGQMLIGVLDEADVTPHSEAALFYAPLCLMRGGLHSGEAFERFKKFSSADQMKADEALVRSQPNQGFWMSGVTWSHSELQELKKIFPKTYQLVLQECVDYRKKSDTEPVHVSSPACEWLK